MPTKQKIAPTKYKWGFHDIEAPIYKSPKGLSQKVVESISHYKNEPAWMRDFRLRALKIFLAKPMPLWGADLSTIDFNNIYYYIKPTEATMHSWDEVPDRIKATFDKLGIPQAEQKYLAGVGSQYDSENVYHNLRASLSKQGVIFSDVETALKEHPEIVRKYFATVIPPGDNKFAALNSAVWSGGSFIYVPPGVRVEQPLQTYFRINAKNMGQFERTLIIVDEGAFVHYIEGCFTKGTVIIANDKIKPIENIKVGDKVLTHTAKYRRVYSVQKKKYNGFLYKIKIFGDSTFVLNVTEEHPFLSVKRNRRNERNAEWEVEWKTPRELGRRDYLVMPIHKAVRKRDTYPFIIKEQSKGKKQGIMGYKTYHIPATAEFFRLVGYYLAEGSVNNDFYTHFSFNVNEKVYIKDVKHLLNCVFGVKKFYEPIHKKNNGISIVVSSAKIARIFKNFGTSSSSKLILNWMMMAEIEKQKELIKGLFRGDGNYYKKQHKSGFKEVFRINTTSYTLARQARDILLRLGVVSFLNKRDRLKEGRQAMYTIGVSGGYMALFGEIVGIPVAKNIHNHKRATMFYADNNYAYFPIKEIKKAYVKDTEVFNFGVEGDESYVAEGLAVHNCSAPIYATSSLHTAVVEIIALRGARVRYTTVQNWSNDVYNLVTKRAFAHQDAVVEWVDFNMGCLAGNSKIYVYNKGIVDIKNVKKGDEVYSTNLHTLIPVKKKVVAVKDNGIQQTYRLVTMDYREIIATGNHPFLAWESGGVGKSSRYLRWKQLKDLQEGEYIATLDRLPNDGKPYEINFDYFPLKPAKYNITIPQKTTTELMWILGAYIGDGYFEYDKLKSAKPRLRRVYFAIPPKDRARKKLERYLYTVFGIDFWRNKGICLTVGSSILAQFIYDLGFGGGASTKRVPQWIYTLSYDQQLAFIEGYLDTDGSERHRMVKNGVQYGQLTFTSCNKNLLEDIKYLMISCGLKPLKISTYVANRKLTEGKVIKEYTTHFLTLNIRENLDSIKQKHAYNQPRIEFVKIREIAPHQKQRVYDLEVEGTHNFIANGIVVHNSKITMKYPGVYLVGRGARADILSMAYAGKGQHQDAGGKAVHLASDTSSRVISKSVSHGGGRTSYRGLLRVGKGARGVKSKVQCDALILDPASRSDTYPVMKIEEDDATIEHEATVSKIGEEQLFYLMSRGLSADEAALMIVNGFIEPLVKELPLEYAVEMNRMIALEMEGSVG